MSSTTSAGAATCAVVLTSSTTTTNHHQLRKKEEKKFQQMMSKTSCYSIIWDKVGKLYYKTNNLITCWKIVEQKYLLGGSGLGSIQNLYSWFLLLFFIFQHVRRKSQNIQGAVTLEDSGLWLLPFDYNNYVQLVEAVPKFKAANLVDCSVGPYCGVPFLMPVIKLFNPKYVSWVNFFIFYIPMKNIQEGL